MDGELQDAIQEALNSEKRRLCVGLMETGEHVLIVLESDMSLREGLAVLNERKAEDIPAFVDLRPLSVVPSDNIQQVTIDGREVTMRADLKGLHNDYSLCSLCNKRGNCVTMEHIGEIGIRREVQAIIWSCGYFEPEVRDSDPA